MQDEKINPFLIEEIKFSDVPFDGGLEKAIFVGLSIRRAQLLAAKQKRIEESEKGIDVGSGLKLIPDLKLNEPPTFKRMINNIISK